MDVEADVALGEVEVWFRGAGEADHGGGDDEAVEGEGEGEEGGEPEPGDFAEGEGEEDGGFEEGFSRMPMVS